MNIIEAWKSANPGQKIRHLNNNSGDYPELEIIKNSNNICERVLTNFISSNRFSDDYYILDDEWEIVKEKKQYICCIQDICCGFIPKHIPNSAKITIEWEE